MYVEGGIGIGLLSLIVAGYKLLSCRVDEKVDKKWCEKLEHITCARMTKGDEKFEKIMVTLSKQAVMIGELKIETKNTNKKLDHLSNQVDQILNGK